eukprot:277430_1
MCINSVNLQLMMTVQINKLNQTVKLLKTFFADTLTYCSLLDNCQALKNHRMRRREHQKKTQIISKTHTNDSLKEIISATLNAMHCYISHKEEHLFRLERSQDNLHFITPKDEDEKS